IIIGYGFGADTMFIALAAGADATQAFIDALPPFIMGGLQTAAGLLPAIGLGVLLNMMWDNKKIIYFLLGFALVSYLAIPTLGMAIIGVFLMLVNLYRDQDLHDLEKKLEKAKGFALSDEEVFFNE
ncbi:MAG TPA: PTS sugar transporter subunit IIC, partial [Atopobiaceae bacterium]|nr:PTS sugar transporter subunit IIC [Atopobiaceae bacterium]